MKKWIKAGIIYVILIMSVLGLVALAIGYAFLISSYPAYGLAVLVLLLITIISVIAINKIKRIM